MDWVTLGVTIDGGIVVVVDGFRLLSILLYIEIFGGSRADPFSNGTTLL